jgi:hypothetical protein
LFVSHNIIDIEQNKTEKKTMTNQIKLTDLANYKTKTLLVSCSIPQKELWVISTTLDGVLAFYVENKGREEYAGNSIEQTLLSKPLTLTTQSIEFQF